MIWIALTAFSCAWLVWCERQESNLRWIAKPLASLGFVALAITRSTGDFYDLAIVMGAVLGMGGDIALLGKGRRWFLVGLGVFLAGHLAYLAGLLSEATTVGLLLGAVPAVVLAAGSWRWLSGSLDRQMVGPVAAYIAVISLMVAAALGAAVARPTAAIGAILFAVSDLAVARQAFVTPGFANRAVGLPLYYAGQILIALSVG